MTTAAGDNGFLTSLGVAALSVLGGIAKGAQWRDAKTGKLSMWLLIPGVALCLVMATAVHALGVQFGIEPWYQMMASGVLCYVGPDPIIRGLAGSALKRFGVSSDGTDPPANKP